MPHASSIDFKVQCTFRLITVNYVDIKVFGSCMVRVLLSDTSRTCRCLSIFVYRVEHQFLDNWYV